MKFYELVDKYDLDECVFSDIIFYQDRYYLKDIEDIIMYLNKFGIEDKDSYIKAYVEYHL